MVGLKGCRYLDSLAQRAERVEEGEEVRFGGEVGALRGSLLLGAVLGITGTDVERG